MCGRAYIKITPAVKAYCKANNINILEWSDDLYLPNMPPTTELPVIIRNTDGLIGKMMRWQLHPSWSREAPTYKAQTFNARIETVLTLNSYRTPVRERRAIVPMAGFVEWQRVGQEKQPYYIDAGDAPLLVAGIWENWRDQVLSFAVITQPANDEFAWLHDRMPLTLTPAEAGRWLDPYEGAEKLVHELAGHSLKLFPRKVSQKVNNARNKEPLEFVA